MDWYSPGRPIIGSSPEDNARTEAAKIANQVYRKENGLKLYFDQVKNLYTTGYKLYEYELLEIYQNCIEKDFVNKNGIFKKE